MAAAGLAALLALGGWWFGARAESGAAERAKEAAAELVDAAADWKRDHDQTGCPSVTQLLVDRVLDRQATLADPWGNRFRIVCRAGQVQVRSAGQDKQFSTADDIAVAGDWKS